MEHDLIKALLIFEAYNPDFSTHCEHDVMSICGVDVDEVSEEDNDLLHEYGFLVNDSCGEEAYESFRWGSC